jgi:hypothetical protein
MLGVGGIVSESSLAFGALSCRDDMDSPVGTVFVSGLQPLNVSLAGYLGLRPRLIWFAPLALRSCPCLGGVFAKMVSARLKVCA